MIDSMCTLPLLEVEDHAPGFRTLIFERTFDARPGQFVFVWLPHVDEKPFSISALEEDRIHITVRAVGPFSRCLLNIKVGDLVGIRGPFGNGFEHRDEAILVAGGMGVAPIHFLARSLSSAGHRPIILLGARNVSEILFLDFFTHLGVRIATDDGSAGHSGIVTELLHQALVDCPDATVFGCGPEPMLTAVHEIARGHGVPCQLSFEHYMKCGIGLCGQCCVDGAGFRLCVEGPVLTGQQISQLPKK